MNTPNKLTVLRMLLVLVMVIIYLLNIPGNFLDNPTKFLIINLIFIIGSLTDQLDGYLARKNNQVTNFGKFLDPIADKILVISAMLILVEASRIPAWIPIIIITREFAVSGYRLIVVEQNGKVVAANIWGKIKTVTQMIAIILAFLDVNSYGTIFNTQLDTIPFILNCLTTLFMSICVIATIFSGYEYLKDGKDIFKDIK